MCSFFTTLTTITWPCIDEFDPYRILFNFRSRTNGIKLLSKYLLIQVWNSHLSIHKFLTPDDISWLLMPHIDKQLLNKTHHYWKQHTCFHRIYPCTFLLPKSYPRYKGCWSCQKTKIVTVNLARFRHLKNTSYKYVTSTFLTHTPAPCSLLKISQDTNCWS